MGKDNIEVLKDTAGKPKYDDWVDSGDTESLEAPSGKRAVSEDTPLAPEYKTLVDTSTLNESLDGIAKTISQEPLSKDDYNIDRIRKFINEDMNNTIKAKKSINKVSLFTKPEESTDGEISIEDIAKIITDNDIKRANADAERDKVDSDIIYKQQEVSNKIYSVLLRNDSFNKNITSMYYKKSLEYQFMHLMTSRMILDSNRLGFDKLDNTLKYVVKNTAMPEYVKTQTFEAIKGKARSRLADSVLDSVNSMVSKDGGEDDGGDALGKKTHSKVNSILMTVVGANVARALSKTELGKKVLSKTKQVTEDPSSLFRSMAEKISGDDSNVGRLKKGAKSALTGVADILGTDDIDTELSSFSSGLKSPAMIDNQSIISQNEVVPGYLAKILKEVTLIRVGSRDESKVDEMSYDYTNREFTTSAKLDNKVYSSIVNKIKAKGKSNRDTELAKSILTSSKMIFNKKDAESLRLALVSFISSGGKFKDGTPEDSLYDYMDNTLTVLVKAGLYNLTAPNNPNRDEDVENIQRQFERIRSELPDISKIIDSEVDVGHTRALSSSGLLKKVNDKYVVDMEKYISLLESRELTAKEQETKEDKRIEDTIEPEADKPKTFKDRMYKLAEKSGVLGKPIKNIMDNHSISNYIDTIRPEIERGDDSNKTITVLKDSVNTVFEKLGIINHIKKELSPTDLLEVFTVMDKTANDKDTRGRVLVYLHSKGIITDDSLKSAITADTTPVAGSKPVENMKSTLKNMADANVIKTMKESRELTAKEQETKEDKRIEKIVTAVAKKLKGGDDEKENKKRTLKDRVGSWMNKGKVDSTKIGARADELAKNKPGAPAGSGTLGKILGILGMALPAVISIFTGIGDKIGFIWDLVKGAGGFLLRLGGNIISGVVSGVGTVISGLGSIISGIGGMITSGFSMLSNAIGGMLTGIKGFVGGAFDKMKSAFGFGDDADVDADTDRDKKKDDKDKDSKKDSKKTDKKVTKKKGLVSKMFGKAGSMLKGGAKIAGKVALGAVKTVGRVLVPGAGMVMSGMNAANAFADGDYGYALAHLGAGALSFIPGIGGIASIAASEGLDYFRGNSVNVDKSLYDGKSFPNNMDGDSTDRLILHHIRKHETGKAEGKYDMAGDIGDKAGISFGAYQMTEKSGNLKEYIRRLVAVTNDPLGQKFLDGFKGNMYSGNKNELEKYLKATGASNAGKYIQDGMYKEMFLDPAKKLTQQFGINEPAAISQVVDHSVNAGLGGAKRMIQRAGGDYSTNGIIRARKEDYNAIINSKPHLAKYKKGWFNRVDSNAELFLNHKVDPNTIPPHPGGTVDPLAVANAQGNIAPQGQQQPTNTGSILPVSYAQQTQPQAQSQTPVVSPPPAPVAVTAPPPPPKQKTKDEKLQQLQKYSDIYTKKMNELNNNPKATEATKQSVQNILGAVNGRITDLNSGKEVDDFSTIKYNSKTGTVDFVKDTPITEQANSIINNNQTPPPATTVPTSYVQQPQAQVQQAPIASPVGNNSHMNSYQPTVINNAPATPPASLSIAPLEKIMTEGNKHLSGINANTTNLAQRQGLLLAELIKITELLSNKDGKAPTKPVPPSNNKNTNKATTNNVTAFDSKVNVSKGTTVK